jgi:hypothetical protein
VVGARLDRAQLVDTQTDFQLWSERFDREMQDVFEVQTKWRARLPRRCATLHPKLEALADKPTENPQAYDLYLRASATPGD